MRARYIDDVISLFRRTAGGASAMVRPLSHQHSVKHWEDPVGVPTPRSRNRFRDTTVNVLSRVLVARTSFIYADNCAQYRCVMTSHVVGLTIHFRTAAEHLYMTSPWPACLPNKDGFLALPPPALVKTSLDEAPERCNLWSRDAVMAVLLVGAR